MRLATVLKKIVFLSKKINNPPFFLYLVHHYLRWDMPTKLAERIAEKNADSFSRTDNEFVLATYDGSNQIVHPDMVMFENLYWLVATPYPYGMEEYENPCLYSGKSLLFLSQHSDNPIARQQEHEIGFHLSDPCLFVYNSLLFCAYRENTRFGGINENIIYIKSRSQDGIWGNAVKVVSSKIDPLLSPAFYVSIVQTKERLYMIHVNRTGNQSALICSVFNDDLKIMDSYSIECDGLPEKYYIWHIAIAYKNGQKYGNQEDDLYGLFLLRNVENSNSYKLFLAFRPCLTNWKLLHEVKTPIDIQSTEMHPYKACFIPNSNDILYSYVDNKGRYRLTIIEGIY